MLTPIADSVDIISISLNYTFEHLRPAETIMATETVKGLAVIISENTAIVEQYLSLNNLSHPSFSVDGPRESLVPRDAGDIEAARLAVIDATSKLRNMMLGPREFLQSFAVHLSITTYLVL